MKLVLLRYNIREKNEPVITRRDSWYVPPLRWRICCSRGARTVYCVHTGDWTIRVGGGWTLNVFRNQHVRKSNQPPSREIEKCQSPIRTHRVNANR